MLGYYFWNCFKCFSKHIKVPYKFFDIVQFSRSCAPRSFDRRPVYFTTEVVFCQVFFFEAFELSELGPLRSFSEQTGACRGETPPFPYGNRSATQTPHWGVCCFATAEQLSVYWFFSHASCRPQEVILFVRRLALKYNTIPPPLCQHFLITFLRFF